MERASSPLEGASAGVTKLWIKGVQRKGSEILLRHSIVCHATPPTPPSAEGSPSPATSSS